MYPRKGYIMVTEMHSLRNTKARGSIQRQASAGLLLMLWLSGTLSSESAPRAAAE
eukprot:CAMPEP_0174296604 /NCGR_PEP_ID=MMETSP0809-20121228/48401_1 /TAXON_ID=73025 ORGANISM="Eutreptiella gymnastica-like, Strain CCMP1594" /NCGR_SAMPLE_ID=MMETSP0809 /ASSEMBLY_ACC=CAM_ASM_000658 /LENGTH=54 /DNA_ID=CAMNT_0015399721 /DNA_START=11 /DNA_END=175 /DNA_ORIENTATION=-